MKVAAFLVMIAAWGCLFMWRSVPARVAQMIVFGLLGTLFTLAGGFQFWWNSNMQRARAARSSSAAAC